MTVTPEMLTALSGLVFGLAGILVSVFTAISAAKKTEVEALRSTVEALQAENRRLREENAELRNRIDFLEGERNDRQKRRMI